MSGNIIQLNQDLIHTELKDFIILLSRSPLLKCIWPEFRHAVSRISQKHYGIPKYLQVLSVTSTRKHIFSDKALGMVEAIGQVFPKAKYQRCTVHFYRNVLSVVPKQKVADVAKILKAIHAHEDKVPVRQGGLSKKEFCAGCLTVPP